MLSSLMHLSAVSPRRGEWIEIMKNADDAIVKLISLKLGPEKAVHKFSYDGKIVTGYLGTKIDEISVTFNTDSKKAAGGKHND